ncbi:hypothetical protein N7513_012410 [Penicillium frequentans]|uniref:Uncharacterized protein n=1 Tax=Penicillium frequentans TaxID=3151616 RepID=A0AAD6D1G9_9EURO|nr:hypothetical protein N7513_012410 [Penicillium glabrum]KAJ5547295.1 hypothetical protein N7494_004880 [Penicillium glabrum]
MPPQPARLVSGKQNTDTLGRSWAQEILVKASGDSRHQPWKRAFAGQEINVLSPRVPDVVKFDCRNICSNAENGN